MLDDARRAAARTARLYAVTQALSGALTPDDVTLVIVREGLAATGAAAAGVMLRTPDGNAFEIVRSVGYPPEVVESFRRVPADSRLPVPAAARDGEPLWIHEITPGDRDDPEVAAARARSPNRSAAVVPLANGSVLGAITLSYAEPQAFHDDERGFLLALGRLCGQALHRANLLAEVQALNAQLEDRVLERTRDLQAARERESALAALSDALQAASLPEQVGELAMSRLGPAFGANYASFSRLDGRNLRLTTTWGDVPAVFAAFNGRDDATLDETPLLRRMVAADQALYVADYALEPGARDYDGEPMALGYEPVRAAGGRIAGVLSAGRPANRGPWLPEERALLARAAFTVGLALERAEAAARLAAQTAELEARAAEQETFVFTVSHDLRAPLLSIQGMSELLEEAVTAGDQDSARFFLARVQKNVARMNQLLSDLLALSRVGHVEQSLEDIDLGEAVRLALIEAEPVIEGRGVELSVATEWPAVHYARSELAQLLSNLVGNAIKWAGRPGEPPRVAIAWAARDGLVELRVDDNGPGIEPTYRQKVFGLFQKLDANAPGTGVGLAIVKRIAERHAGRAWVEDAPAALGGARLAVTLPAAGTPPA